MRTHIPKTNTTDGQADFQRLRLLADRRIDTAIPKGKRPSSQAIGTCGSYPQCLDSPVRRHGPLKQKAGSRNARQTCVRFFNCQRAPRPPLILLCGHERGRVPYRPTPSTTFAAFFRTVIAGIVEPY